MHPTTHDCCHLPVKVVLNLMEAAGWSNLICTRPDASAQVVRSNFCRFAKDAEARSLRGGGDYPYGHWRDVWDDFLRESRQRGARGLTDRNETQSNGERE